MMGRENFSFKPADATLFLADRNAEALMADVRMLYEIDFVA
jgi:hypothetical protein